MASILQCTLNLPSTQPTAALGYLPFASSQAGQLDTDAEFYYSSASQCIALPELTANPAANPAAGSVFFYSVLTGANYTLRIKNSAGTVVATGNLT